jgi:integrase
MAGFAAAILPGQEALSTIQPASTDHPIGGSRLKEVDRQAVSELWYQGCRVLFESSWKKPYSTRGVRKLLTRYATAAGIAHPVSPHRLRHFLLSWLKAQGIDDALIQPYSGHEYRQSLEVYSPAVPGRRPAALRRGHRPLPGLSAPPMARAFTLVWGW